jgi:hypothetical protein
VRKRREKRLIYQNVVCMALIAVLVLSSFAFTVDPNMASDSELLDADSILIQHGLPLEILPTLTLKEKLEWASAILEDPDSVSITNTFMETDNLAEIELFLETPEEDLIEMGAEPDAIARTKASLDEIEQKPEELLAQELDISITEAKYLKKAIEKGKSKRRNNGESRNKESNRKKDMSVNASAPIAASKLSYSQIVGKVTTPGVTQLRYMVTMSYNWITPYFVRLYSDKICLAWGGGFVSEVIMAEARYHIQSTEWSWMPGINTLAGSRNMSVFRPVANAGIEFTFPQTISFWSITSTKTGSASVRLTKDNKFNNNEVEVLSQYLHRTLNWGVTISWTAPGFTPGGAWNESAQRRTKVRD